jgi:hypothetical protein
MTRKQKGITEKDIEAIWNESLRKRNSEPRYAEAFQRVTDQMKKMTEVGYVKNDQDQKALDYAMGDLMMIEMALKLGIDPNDLELPKP